MGSEKGVGVTPRKPIFLIAVLLVTVGLFSAGSGLPTPPCDDGQQGRLVVVTYNVGGCGKKARPKRRQALEGLVRDYSPNLLLLQECRKKDYQFLADVLGMEDSLHIPYQGKNKRKGGLAVFSSYPLLEDKVRFFPASKHGLGFLVCELEVRGRALRVANIHLDRIERIRDRKAMPKIPWKTAMNVVFQEVMAETRRSKQVQMVLDQMGGGNGQEPVILAGDFNSICYSTAIRKVQKRFRDALWPSLAYFTNSYKELGFPLKPRIDYIFHSPDLSPVDGGVIRIGPGDHYPVWAELTLRHRRG